MLFPKNINKKYLVRCVMAVALVSLSAGSVFALPSDYSEKITCGWDGAIPKPGIAKIGLNQDYVNDTKSQRHFDPSKKGISVFDTVDITLAPPCSGPGKDGFDVYREIRESGVVRKEKMPMTLGASIDGIETITAQNHFPQDYGPTLVWKEFPLRSETTEVNEKIITALGQGKQLKVRVSYPLTSERNSVPKLSAEKVVSFADPALCVQIYGKGDKRIVGMQGASSNLVPGEMVARIEEWRVYGMEDIDPFKKYKDKFSYFIDLKNHNDSPWLDAATDFMSDKIKMNKFNLILNKAKNDSSCKDAGAYAAYVSQPDRNNPSIAGLSTLGKRIFLVARDVGPEILTHELGHAIGRLKDERVDQPIRPIPPSWIIRTNCTTDPDKDYAYGGKMYGKKIVGCVTTERTTTGEIVYRSSESSIMNNLKSFKFNGPSCIYVLKWTLGSNASAKSYFPECATMDIEREGASPVKSSSVPTPYQGYTPLSETLGSTNEIRVSTLPKSTTIKILNSSLALTYDSNQKEASLKADFEVSVAAGLEEVKIPEWGFLLKADDGAPAHTTYGSGLVESATGADKQPNQYSVSLGQTATFKLTAVFDPKIMFAGSYAVSLQSVFLGYPKQRTVVKQEVSDKTTNSVSIKGSATP